ncbi:hypothetical protein GCM10022281_24800 [Sphingomonas rosea]|uniref:Putative auto-transporter adhesin head GIN domain-containing protein n=1 Tax=Sphingomonas rosea TaxID=335605 RepID=A0ABP7UGF5_9SPHN
MTRPRIVIILASLVSATLPLGAALVPATPAHAEGWNVVHRTNAPMVSGSGRLMQQARAVAPFRRIETLGAENVTVQIGPRASVVVTADDNILPLVTTEVRGGTLRIASRGSFRSRTPIRVAITVPALDAYQSTGSGNATITGIDSPRLALTLTGSGNIRATGRTGELRLGVNGSGNADVAGLAAARAEVTVHGSGNADVRAEQNLDAAVYGSGSINYAGRAAVQQRRYGSGSIVARR